MNLNPEIIYGIIFVSIFFLVTIIPINAQIYYHDFPPTPDYRHIKTENGTTNASSYYATLNIQGLNGIHVKNGKSGNVYVDGGAIKTFNPMVTSNATVHATQVNTTLTIQGLHGIQVYGSDNNKIIYINGTVKNGTAITGLSCNNNFQLHTVSSSGTFTCAINNATTGNLLLNSTNVSTTYTATKNDDLILANATNGNFTVTIPSITTTGTGKFYVIEKVDYSKNFITIKPTSSTIEDFKNLNITNPMDAISIQNNGTIWFGTEKPSASYLTFPLKSYKNSWYGSWANQGTPTTFNPSNNTLYAVPFTITRSVSLSKIESEVTTQGISSNCRMALYADSGQGYPLNKVSNSDVSNITRATTSTGTIQNVFAQNINLPAGNYYNAVDCNAIPTAGGIGTITQDAINSTGALDTSSNTAYTVNINVGAHSNKILVVGVSLIANVNPSVVVSSVKIGSTSFTKIKQSDDTTSGVDSEAWYLASPPTGKQTITVTVSVSNNFFILGVYSLYNVNQATPIGTSVANSDTQQNPTISITPTNTNAWILDNVAKQQGGSQTPSNTQAWNVELASSIGGMSQYNSSPTINSPNTLSWSGFIGTQRWNDVAIEVIPSAGSVSGTMPVLRGIPTSSLSSFLGMPDVMGATNGGTMYSTGGQIMSGGIGTLPDPFPVNATIKTTAVPEILVNVKG